MDLVGRLRTLSVRKERKLLLALLARLQEALANLQPELRRAGRERALDTSAFHEFVHLQASLREQIGMGPMSPAETRAFLEPHLRGMPADLAHAVLALLEQTETDLIR
jgi:hypothetical protein